jgi:hypothetical protein
MIPSLILFLFLIEDQINKFHLNLMSQNRKRPHDQTTSQANNGEAGGNVQTNGGGSGSNDSSPLSKRTLMSTNNTNNPNSASQNSKNNLTVNSKTAAPITSTSVAPTTTTKQAFRASQKSNKPTQAINRVNSPEDIYYQINAHLKQLRHEVQILALRKLARKPYKSLANEYQAIYQTFAKLSDKAAANIKTKDAKGKASDVEMSGDEKNKDTEENMLVVEEDEKTNENSNDKNDLVVEEETVEDSKKVDSGATPPAPEVVID